ncbi:MAG TPA: hypothetical protein VJ953_00790 [Saprospiraceae bacterium]|nr:hypothetical protein [Saprospiraceae bacterium]
MKHKRKHSIKQLGISFLLLCLFGSSQVALAQQNPEVTLRFNNPVLDCNTGVYCLDVEYRADVPGREVFGTNVRFFYNDDVMEFIDIRDFQGGYSLVAPFPTQQVASGLASAFGYPGNASLEYINANIQLTNSSAPSVVLPSDGSWVKLFQVCFQVTEDEISNPSAFCPSVIWDLEQNPNDEGYQPASQGPVTTLVNPGVSGASTAADERVEQFNWNYVGEGAAPFGERRSVTCLDASCLIPPPPPPNPVDLPALSPMYKIMLGAVLMGLVILVGFNRKLF